MIRAKTSLYIQTKRLYKHLTPSPHFIVASNFKWAGEKKVVQCSYLVKQLILLTKSTDISTAWKKTKQYKKSPQLEQAARCRQKNSGWMDGWMDESKPLYRLPFFPFTPYNAERCMLVCVLCCVMYEICSLSSHLPFKRHPHLTTLCSPTTSDISLAGWLAG